MFLKSIEIYGFKSFADRTRIDFSDGISALLGPNGCGKSNVVDAIKWVLGEQASKSLRAEKMEDIIFNGTETRKPLGMAEVAMTIENSNGILPIETSEIVVKRRLYRSGESEYQVNGTVVKLRELRELFWDTGIGKSAYSVMEQGRIDQVLSSKPEERRYLFEEAAGITRFKLRGQEADRKLEKTEENMRQVEGILGEVKRSYDTLKVQAEKTLAYRASRERIFNLELDLQLLRLRAAKQELGRRDEEIAERRARRDKIKADIDSLERSLEANMDAVNILETRLAERQKTIYGLAIEKNSKEKERSLMQERSREAQAALAQAELKRKALLERIEEAEEGIDGKEAELKAIERRIGEMQANAESFEARVAEAQERIARNEASIAGKEEAVKRSASAQEGLEAEREALSGDIAAQLDRRLKESGYSGKAQEGRAAKVDDALKSLAVVLEGRAALVADWMSLPEGGRTPAAELARAMSEGLSEARRSLEALAEGWAAYKASSPSFIDEFLSPEGFLTKRRALDERVQAERDTRERLRAEIGSLRDENRDLGVKIEEWRATLGELKVGVARDKAQAEACSEAASMLRRELASLRARDKELEDAIWLERKRVGECAKRLAELDEEIAEIERRGKELTLELERLDGEIREKTSDLKDRRESSRKKAEELAQAQEALERVFMAKAQAESEIKAINEGFRESHSRDLAEFEERMFELNVPLGTLRDELAKARQELKDLGSVNLMAPEEFAETKQRYDFLTTQLADLAKARDDLKRITDEIRTESTELFLATYNKIKKNFHNMFRRLFGGGRAELRLVDPDHVLSSGIEIYAQPPGKRLENISLLSGGEKSLTAVGLLFATYLVKPSPFCFLDEIDAALDEQNVLRFVNLLREFGSRSQFIIITHNKKTVAGADALLGVTMEESGVTKTIAIRLEKGGEKGVAWVPEPFEEEDVEPETGRELPQVEGA